MNAMKGLSLPRRRQSDDRGAGGYRLAVALALLTATCFASRCEAQCVDRANRVPAAALQGFLMDPASVLREVRNDRSKLSGRLAAYIVTDISVLPKLRHLASQSANV